MQIKYASETIDDLTSTIVKLEGVAKYVISSLMCNIYLFSLRFFIHVHISIIMIRKTIISSPSYKLKGGRLISFNIDRILVLERFY